MSAFSIFFYRPIKKASDYCADQFVIPLMTRLQPYAEDLRDRTARMVERAKPYARGMVDRTNSAMEAAKPYANSLVGRIAQSAVYETGGALIGAAAGQLVVGPLFVAMGPEIVPSLCALGLVTAVFTKEKRHIALFTTGFLLPAFFSKGKQAEYFVQLGQYVGRTAGGILGGYTGLTKLAGAKIDLVDRINPTNSYLVNMLKFEAAGRLFDGVIVSSSIPYVGGVINIPRNALKSICQTLGYNSHAAIPVFRECLRKKQLSITVPFVVQVMCHRYCVENSNSIALQTTQLLSDTILPSTLQKVGRVISCNALAIPLQRSLDYLGTNSDRFATILMRGFHEYFSIVKQINIDCALRESETEDLISIDFASDEKANGDSAFTYLGVSPARLEEVLKDKIPGSKLVSPLFDMALKSSPVEWTNSLIGILRNTEKDLIGKGILSEEQEQILREFLPIYLKYYLIYIVLNGQKLNYELTQIDEKAFFLDLSEAFFSIYTCSSKPNWVAERLQGATSVAVEELYKFRKFFELTDGETLATAPIDTSIERFIAPPRPPEEESSVIAPITISAEHCVAPPSLPKEDSSVNAPIDTSKEYFSAPPHPPEQHSSVIGSLTISDEHFE